jgi:nickel/cobalt transporter (NiCoT) family protein
MAIAVSFAAGAVAQRLPLLASSGAIIGAGVSGIFLWVIGILNLMVLLDVLKVWRFAKSGAHNHDHLDRILQKRGFINRMSGGRLPKLITRSWQMYPLGILFGLGFDTASEIGLLAMTAGATVAHLPMPAVLSLAVLFAAGMSAIDATDSILMTKAYNWALTNPLRKIFYNLTTTGLSVAAALLIGTLQLARVLAALLGLHGRFFDWIDGLDFSVIGYVLAGMFLSAWMLSMALWKFGPGKAGAHSA